MEAGRIVSYRVTDAVSEPLTPAEAKEFARIDTTAEDATLIPALIKACRMAVENHCGIGLIVQTWEDIWDAFPSRYSSGGTLLSYKGQAYGGLPYEIQLRRAPLASTPNLAVYVTDPNDVETTFDPTSYVVDLHSPKPRFWLKTNANWPSYREKACLRVRYDVGYANAAAIPENIKMAVRQLFATYYENREQVVSGAMPVEVTRNYSAAMLLKPYREIRI